MKYIFAPWRADYIKRGFKMTQCVLCNSIKMKNDKKALILGKGEHNFIILNKYPYNAGHLMIAPFLHLESPENAKPQSIHEMTDLMQMSLGCLRQYYKPQGFNMGMNIDRSAGAGVLNHYHFHIVPRWTGDSNFMPVIGETKVTIEDLSTTYEKLLPLFQEKMKSSK